MRKVSLTMTEQEKYEIIKSLVEHNGNKDRAALKLGCTKRHVNRLILKYKSHGKAAFIHGNKGRKPAHTFSDAKKNEIITLYNNKYQSFDIQPAKEIPRKRNIPSARHPWRSETFLKHSCHKLTDKMLAS